VYTIDRLCFAAACKARCALLCLQAATGLDWQEMLFFDDEPGNVHKVGWVAQHASHSS
jgi:hypothetical protein